MYKGKIGRTTFENLFSDGIEYGVDGRVAAL